MATHLPPLVDRYFTLLNAGKIDALLELFTREARHSGPLGGETIQGRASIRLFAERFTERFPGIHWTVTEAFEVGPEVAVTWAAEIPVPGQGPLGFRGVHVFTMEPGGLIQSLRIYWNPLPVIKALPGA